MKEYNFNSKSDVRLWLSGITERWDKRQYHNWDIFFDDSVDMLWDCYSPQRGINELQVDAILSREDDSDVIYE